MAASTEKAFEAAEEQRAARGRVKARVLRGAAARQGRRIEHLEIYATWDSGTLKRLERILGAYMWAEGVDSMRHHLGSADDFLQEAITQTLRWPGELWSDELENLVLFTAKRNIRTKAANVVDRREASLQQSVVSDGEKNLGDLVADAYWDEDGMIAPVELWYVEQYVRHLLREGRSDEEVSSFLGVRRAVVEHLRATIREELELGRYQQLTRYWTPDRCLKAIRDFAAEHDGYGPSKEQQSAAEELPAAGTLVHLFGTRRKAMEEAGVRIPRSGRKPLDKVKVSKDLVSWVRRHGHWPCASEIRKASAAGELHSTRIFMRVYGAQSRFALYSGALKTLGKDALDGIEPPPMRYGTILPRDAAERIRQWQEEHGRWPGIADLSSSEELIGKSSAHRIFGSTAPDQLGAAVTAMLATDPA